MTSAGNCLSLQPLLSIALLIYCGFTVTKARRICQYICIRAAKPRASPSFSSFSTWLRFGRSTQTTLCRLIWAERFMIFKSVSTMGQFGRRPTTPPDCPLPIEFWHHLLRKIGRQSSRAKITNRHHRLLCKNGSKRILHVLSGQPDQVGVGGELLRPWSPRHRPLPPPSLFSGISITAAPILPGHSSSLVSRSVTNHNHLDRSGHSRSGARPDQYFLLVIGGNNGGNLHQNHLGFL